MKIAVIGATGMIGHHTALSVIARGHELVVVHRAGSDLSRLGDTTFQRIEADATDSRALTQALRKVDSVIHCAGYYPTQPRAWQEDVRRARAQMIPFYDACARCDLHKIVFLGAAIALPPEPHGQPGHADLHYPRPPRRANGYLQSKWALDTLALQRARKGLPVVIGIPSMTFGEYDYGPTTGRLICDIANGRLPAYVEGKRNVVYAGDGGRGLVMACEAGTPGERYLFTGENLTMSSLVERIAAAASVHRPRRAPLTLARAIAMSQGLRYRRLGGPLPKIDDTAIAVLAYGQYLQSDKSRDALGWTPKQSADEAIQRALQWFRGQGMVSH